jgi:hypothetical protein
LESNFYPTQYRYTCDRFLIAQIIFIVGHTFTVTAIRDRQTHFSQRDQNFGLLIPYLVLSRDLSNFLQDGLESMFLSGFDNLIPEHELGLNF